IVNSNGWTRQIVEDGDAGIYVDAARPEELADALVTLRDSPDMCARFGAIARRLATHVFARDVLATHFIRVLENAAAGRPPHTGGIWTMDAVRQAGAGR